MTAKPLISVIILCYKNFRYLFEALESILHQTYDNIEIIISNDGSEDFDEQSLHAFLKKNRRYNIKNVVVQNLERNVGTVKNANSALQHSKGDYIMLFAGDDAMYGDDVIAQFASAFESLPEEELVVTSQLAMYDDSMQKVMHYFVSDNTKATIVQSTPDQLFCKLSTSCFIPAAGTCYKKEVFERYGYFDERYCLVEDWSYFLKLSRSGVKFNYFDFVSFKHRDGGVSHGNKSGVSATKKKYDADIIHIMEFEVVPYLHLFERLNRRKFNSWYKMHVAMYQFKYVSTRRGLAYCISHINFLLIPMLRWLSHRKKATLSILLSVIFFLMHWQYHIEFSVASLLSLSPMLIGLLIDLIALALLLYGLIVYGISVHRLLKIIKNRIKENV